MRKLIFTVIKAVLFFAGWIMLVSVIPAPDCENPAVWRFLAELIPLLAIAGISVLFWWIEKKEICVCSFDHLGFCCLIGTVGGVLWVGAVFLIMRGIGVLKVEGYAPVSLLWLWVLAVFLNTVMQELLVRGYLYQMIKSNYNVGGAVLVSSALFTLLHGGAFEAGILPVFNVFTMSLLMSVLLEETGSLAAPIMMHFLWNGIGALVLGGVSLAEDYPHVLTCRFSGNEFLSGGVCGMEGSVVVFVVNVALISLVYIRRGWKGE